MAATSYVAAGAPAPGHTPRLGEWDAGGDHEYAQVLLLWPQVIVQDFPEVDVAGRGAWTPEPQLVAQLMVLSQIACHASFRK